MQRTLIIVCFHMAVILGVFFMGALLFVSVRSNALLPLSSESEFYVTPHDDVSSISSKLYAANAVDYKIFFQAVFMLNSADGSIKAGEYHLTPRMTYKDLVALFHQGGVSAQPQ